MEGSREVLQRLVPHHRKLADPKIAPSCKPDAAGTCLDGMFSQRSVLISYLSEAFP